MVNTKTARCLILACGNTLRQDDGIGPFLASWAEQHFAHLDGVRIVSAQQWTPELSAEIASAEAVLFIDCSVAIPPGTINIAPVPVAEDLPRLMTHHLDATSLLALAREYYSTTPREAMLFVVGAASLELREGISDAMKAAIPAAQRALEDSVLNLLGEPAQRK